MKNETITREALFIWTKKTNQRGLSALKTTSTDATNEMVPEQKMTPDERKRNNLKKTFEIQEGAAEGKSICKKNFLKLTFSQDSKRKEDCKDSTFWKGGLKILS